MSRESECHMSRDMVQLTKWIILPSSLVLVVALRRYNRKNVENKQKVPFEGAKLCIGGHKYGVWIVGNRCYKRFQTRGRGEREYNFLRIANEKTCDWYDFVPRLANPSVVERNDSKWLVMENILSGFKDGVIMDVKMGRRTWGANTSKAKRKRKAQKDRIYTSFEFGVRLVAAEIKSEKFGDTKLLGDKVGYPVTNRRQLQTGILNFLNTKELRLRATTILRRIMKVFKNERGFIFYSSSLLFSYDFAAKSRADTLRVKMIGTFICFVCVCELMISYFFFLPDFAHVEPSSELDESYIVGLQTLVKILSLGLNDDNDKVDIVDVSE